MRRPFSKKWTRERLAPLAFQAAPWVALAALAAFWPRGRRDPKPGLSVQVHAEPESFDAAEPGRGRLAAAPHHIPLRGWKDVLWRTYREITCDRLPAVAGGVTFYTLLALFPAIGVFVSLYGLFNDVTAVQAQLNQFAVVLPGSVIEIVGDQMLRLANRPTASLSVAFLISLLLSVWSANAGMKALFDGLNIAYDEAEKRSYVVKTAFTYVFTLGLLVFLTLVSAILVAVPLYLEGAGLSEFAVIWLPLRWLVILGLAATAFSMVYRYGPCRARARWRWVSTGGVFAAVMWLVGSLGFSWYVNNIAHFDVTYGSLGAVIGFMLWIWFSVMVVLIGAELNAEIEHQTALDSTTGPAQPMGVRGAAMADTVGLAFHFDARKVLSKVWVDGTDQAERVLTAARLRKPQPNSSSKADNRAA
ncbi:MAG: YihY/virulence factor BrkB family protein [Phenylobacterium sp.]|uniref:YihY/virulence factor BrkB family protein n=1 Tax=Phenylobacterium sp. TaxID=1871053 RepID=UPI0027300758|nr:YihY/virulence factor BrkB family protein [Phenylobacterium sp.]MDP2009117.1 YihY/virulence factor BrkB family protein [Phenylobacterium sp.]